MTFEREDGRRRISVRADEALHESIEQFADEQGQSKSDAIRDILRQSIPSDDIEGPTEPKLREAYLWLNRRMDENGKVPADLALSKLAQEFQIDKRFVKRLYLLPLERRGWIEPEFGDLSVRQARK